MEKLDPGTRTKASPATATNTGKGGGRLFILVLVVLAGALIGVVYLLAQAGGGNDPAQVAKARSTPERIAGYLEAAAGLAQNEPGKAEAILREAIDAFPGEQSLYIARAELLVAMNDPAGAYADYEKAIAIGPRDAALDFVAGTVANMSGRLDRAVEHYATAQASDKTNWEIPLNLAQIYVKQGKLTDAKASLLTAANLRPDAAIVWHSLAKIAVEENQANLALQHIEKARTLEPEMLAYRIVHARILKRLGRTEEALQLLVGLSESSKRDPEVLQVMGESYGLLGRPSDAADLYAAASDSSPDDGQLAFDAALWLERSGRREAALIYARRAADLNVSNADKMVERLSGAN